MMMNQFIVIGEIIGIGEDHIILRVKRGYDEIGDDIKINITGSIAENVKQYANVGIMAGVKGFIINYENSMVLLAEKITFLSSKKGE